MRTGVIEYYYYPTGYYRTVVLRFVITEYTIQQSIQNFSVRNKIRQNNPMRDPFFRYCRIIRAFSFIRTSQNKFSTTPSKSAVLFRPSTRNSDHEPPYLWHKSLTDHRIGEIQWFLRFHGPPTLAGPGLCGFDRGWSLVVIYDINYQNFGDFMFGKIIRKKLILTSKFSSILIRHTRSRQTFDTWFHNLGPPFIETT